MNDASLIPLLPSSSSSQYPFPVTHPPTWSRICPLVIIMGRTEYQKKRKKSLNCEMIYELSPWYGGLSNFFAWLTFADWGAGNYSLSDLLLSHQQSERGYYSYLGVLLWGLSACLWLIAVFATLVGVSGRPRHIITMNQGVGTTWRTTFPLTLVLETWTISWVWRTFSVKWNNCNKQLKEITMQSCKLLY